MKAAAAHRRQARPYNGQPGAAALVLEVELARPLPDVPLCDTSAGRCYEGLLAIVRLHGQPLGVVDVGGTGQVVTGDALGRAIWRDLAVAIAEHLREDHLPRAKPLGSLALDEEGPPACQRPAEELLVRAPFVSVVIPTRNRPAEIASTLTGLNRIRYPRFEVIVVDNGPSSDHTARLVASWQASFRLRYITEPRPGVSRARNRGLEVADGDYVAFIDDDVTPDAGWLLELMLGFSGGSRVACVTGLIMPRELDTQAQVWFEQLGRFHKGFQRRLLDLHDHRPADRLYPYTMGSFGSGANFAFHAATLQSLGGFDPALGPGTPALGGEDIEMCFRVIRNGWQIGYQPASLVYHKHQRDYGALRQRSYSYGVGLTASLTKTFLDRPQSLPGMCLRLPYAVNHVFNPNSSKNRSRGSTYPGELSRLELKGMLYGPLAYLRSRRLASRRPEVEEG